MYNRNLHIGCWSKNNCESFRNFFLKTHGYLSDSKAISTPHTHSKLNLLDGWSVCKIKTPCQLTTNRVERKNRIVILEYFPFNPCLLFNSHIYKAKLISSIIGINEISLISTKSLSTDDNLFKMQITWIYSFIFHSTLFSFLAKRTTKLRNQPFCFLFLASWTRQ